MRHVHRMIRYSALTALSAVLCAQGAGQRITELRADRVFVHEVTDLGKTLEGAGSVDWSGPNNRLILDKLGVNRYFNIYTVTPDGFRLKPLTLNRSGLSYSRLHNGGPTWYPTGTHFVFTGQNVGAQDYNASQPDTGLHCNLWLADRNGSKFRQLTDLVSTSTDPVGVLNPAFSPDGTRLFWTGCAEKGGKTFPWGKRSLFMAQFSMEDNDAKLTEVQEFQPGDQQDFYESYGFSPDGNRILFAANLREGQPWHGMDICVIDKRDGKLRALTDTPNAWDRHAAFSPDGNKVIWSSSAGIDIRFFGDGGRRWQRYLSSDLWIMDANGRNAKRLTNFTNKKSVQYIGRRAFVGDCAWSPEGDRIAVVIHYEAQNFDVESKVLMLKLGEGLPVDAGEEEAVPGTGSTETGTPDETGKPVKQVPKW